MDIVKRILITKKIEIMTTADENSIIERVNWVHKNREKTRLLEIEMKEINDKINDLSSDTIIVIDELKRDMGNKTDINIKIEKKYYTLTQNSVGVEIKELSIDIER